MNSSRFPLSLFFYWFLFLLLLLLYHQTKKWGISYEESFGPSLFPQLLILVLAGLLPFLFYQDKKSFALSKEKIQWPTKNFWFFLISLPLFLKCFSVLGYFISVGLFTPLWFYLFQYKMKRVILSFTLGFLLFSYLIFYQLLQLPFPLGFFLQE